MTIGEMHDTIKFLKNQGQGGYHSPEEIDRALNMGSFDKYNEEKIEFERTQKISGDLANFKTSSSITISGGFGVIPDGYDYATNASTSTGRQIDIIPESEWFSRVNDPIAVPNSSYPIIAIRDQVQVVPDSLTPVVLYYLKKPAVVEYVYSDSGGDITPNPGASTDSDWTETAQTDIILRACSYLAIPLGDDPLIKLKAYKKQTEGV